MKIATYNVNGVNGRLPVLLRWLKEAQPDVVCLQELKASQESFPIAAIQKAGYGAVWHGQKAWNGVAILGLNTDPVETRRGLPGDPEDPARHEHREVGALWCELTDRGAEVHDLPDWAAITLARKVHLRLIAGRWLARRSQPHCRARMNIRYRVELSEIERDELKALLSGGRHAALRI